MATLTASKEFEIRFSEVDAMSIVWHGSYALYFEDAREAFGSKYGLEYMTIANNGCFAPLVDLTFQYLRPIPYGMKCRIDITYEPTEAAKIIFSYKIYNAANGDLMAKGRSIQVFIDKENRLMWYRPDFYVIWQNRWEVLNDSQ